MANGGDSGVTNGGQTSLEQQETEQVTKEIERETEERYKYLREELPKTSPIPVPETSIIKDETKKGYSQVRYLWKKDGYEYESRWHTHVPTAPEYCQNSWVVKRHLPGKGYGKDARPSVTEYYIRGRGWVSEKIWNDAKFTPKSKRTKEQKELLDNGHWQV